MRSRGSTLFSPKGESRGRTAACSRNESHADGQGCLRGASKLRAASHLAYKLGGGRQRVFIVQPEASGPAAALFQHETFYFTSLIHSGSNLSFGASQCMALSDLSADFLDEESSLTLELRDFTVCAVVPCCLPYFVGISLAHPMILLTKASRAPILYELIVSTSWQHAHLPSFLKLVDGW